MGANQIQPTSIGMDTVNSLWDRAAGTTLNMDDSKFRLLCNKRGVNPINFSNLAYKGIAMEAGNQSGTTGYSSFTGLGELSGDYAGNHGEPEELYVLALLTSLASELILTFSLPLITAADVDHLQTYNSSGNVVHSLSIANGTIDNSQPGNTIYRWAGQTNFTNLAWYNVILSGPAISPPN